MSIKFLNGISEPYLRDLIDDTGIISSVLNKITFSSDFVFAPTRANIISSSDLECGGITNQSDSDKELVNKIKNIYNLNLSLLFIFHDPHAKKGDLSYLGALPENLIESDNGNYYIYPLNKVTEKTILDFRSLCVGYVKFIYVVDANSVEKKEIAVSLQKGCFEGKIIELYANCFDDESWVGVIICH
jgi:hypothetical protein